MKPAKTFVSFVLLCGLFHVALTITIFLIGRFQLLPGTFDENGIGLTFAVDGTTYRAVISDLVRVWQMDGTNAWLDARAPLHAHLYSVSFAAIGRLVGHNILAAEPLNLLYYLAIVSCVYVLGREIFSAGTGLLAATIVAVWPSFLLHSTQLLRDPLSIATLLGLMVVLTMLLAREPDWTRTIVLGAAGSVLITLFWIARGNMWNVVLVALAIAMVLLVMRMARAKKFMLRNTVAMLAVVVVALLVPARFESSTLPGSRPPASPFAIPSASQPARDEGVWTRAVQQISNRRAGFDRYNAQRSNIRGDVRFSGVGDVLRFLPDAVVIGFLAPFPRMWVESGSYGRATRLLTGAETLVMYVAYVAVVFCVWRER
ncbi:MAG TPA: STT3 domain-containing protein, partial [Pyrinomonadaceae bacterium]|nr:STT3 domain-containing protein [Pyrinomonadaceae bacterium]